MPNARGASWSRDMWRGTIYYNFTYNIQCCNVEYRAVQTCYTIQCECEQWSTAHTLGHRTWIHALLAVGCRTSVFFFVIHQHKLLNQIMESWVSYGKIACCDLIQYANCTSESLKELSSLPGIFIEKFVACFRTRCNDLPPFWRRFVMRLHL